MITECADERCCCGRRSRVVLTPRRWRQVRGVASARPGLDKTYPLATVANKPGHRGEHEISRKPLRAGMPGDSGVLVVTRVRSTNTKCTRDRGCNGHPAFPTPSLGRKIYANLGRSAPRDRVFVFEIGEPSLRGAKRRSNPFFLRGKMDCFASLAMTVSGTPSPRMRGESFRIADAPRTLDQTGKRPRIAGMKKIPRLIAKPMFQRMVRSVGRSPR